MIHYTINTGHSRQSPRSEVQDGILPVMAPLLAPGEHPLPGELGRDYRLIVPVCPAGMVATIYRGEVPLVTIGVAGTDADADADAIWPALEQLYLHLTDKPPLSAVDWQAPKRPESVPWCAAVIVGNLGDAAHWIGDFERCLAWAWLSR